LGDLAAGTMVVYRERNVSASDLPAAEAVTPPLPLTLAEQQALIAFAERHSTLTTQRRLELASILAEPLQLEPTQAEARIHGIARSLVGPV
jgi:hypothetical protein